MGVAVTQPSSSGWSRWFRVGWPGALRLPRKVGDDYFDIDQEFLHSTGEAEPVHIQRNPAATYPSTSVHGSRSIHLVIMKITVALLALVLIDSAYSWGGRFNRFSPEMLSNLGYGGYGNNRHASQVTFFKNRNFFFPSGAHFSNWKKLNRMNLMSKWAIFQTFSAFSIKFGQYGLKNSSFSCWVHFSNRKKLNRMNLVSKWAIFQFFSVFSIKLIKMIKKILNFQVELIFRMKRNWIEWAQCQNDQIFKYFSAIYSYLVKTVWKNVYFQVGVILQILKNGIEWA